MLPSFAFVKKKHQPKLRAALSRLCALVMLLAFPSAAQANQRVAFDGATISLQSAPTMALPVLGEAIEMEENDTLLFLSIDLKPGWKTYWRLPGRFGLAPTVSWQSEDGQTVSAEVYYPRPELFNEGGGNSIGYAEPVLWPLVVNHQGQGTLTLLINLGLCEALCIPESATFQVNLADLSALPSPAITDIFALSTALPRPAEPMPQAWQTWLATGNATPLPDTHFMVLESAQDHILLVPGSGTVWPHERSVDQVTLVPGQGAPLVYSTNLPNQQQ